MENLKVGDFIKCEDRNIKGWIEDISGSSLIVFITQSDNKDYINKLGKIPKRYAELDTEIDFSSTEYLLSMIDFSLISKDKEEFLRLTNLLNKKENSNWSENYAN